MAPSLLFFFFFFLCSCISDHVHPQCPTKFTCRGLDDDVHFPFSNTTYPDCGLIILDCSDEHHTRVQLSKPHGTWYIVESSRNTEIAVRDEILKDQLDSDDCDSLNNFTLPLSSSVVFQFSSPLLPFFKCKRENSNSFRPDLFKNLNNYTRCSNYDLYFTRDHGKSLPSLPETFSDFCSAIQLPGIEWDPSKAKESLTSLWSFTYILKWEILPECNNCHKKGGQCQNNSDGSFKCSDSSTQGVAVGILKVAIATPIIGLLVVLMVVAIFYHWRKKRSTKNSPKIEEFLKNFGSLAPKRCKFSEIRKMTNSFQDKLGQGGYGSVFKGQLPDGSMVAVKLLHGTKGKKNKNDGEEFVNEVASISKTSHVNIVTLLGFCVEGPKMALIYEFMPNGSLEKFIYTKNSSKKGPHQLGWGTLYKIAIGIARGLEYLHRGCNTQIVHFDIKPHNILLDEDFSPKISDFGLAKLCLKKESVMSTMGARGTIGYIAPELVSKTFGRVSHKSDVYIYGMMVLEMVSGRKNVDVDVDNTSEIYFPLWIYNQLDHQSEEMRFMGGIMIEEDREIARKLIIVAFWCIQLDPSIRPPMSKVLEMLEGALEDLQIPPNPCFVSSPRTQETNCTNTSIIDLT